MEISKIEELQVRIIHADNLLLKDKKRGCRYPAASL
jgi:hypothetical protein